jgi:hypothetical protein
MNVLYENVDYSVKSIRDYLDGNECVSNESTHLVPERVLEKWG